MNNNLTLNTSFITNFKPEKITNFSFFKKSTQIYCRNFLLYLILLKYNKKNVFSNNSIFIKPFKKKIYTILRSPYRHKLARHQISLNRYYINSTININLNSNLNFNQYKNIIKFINFLKTFSNNFESNLIFIHRFKNSFPFSFKSNFLLKNFIN